MDTWRARLVVLACVFTVLTFAGPAIAGERLVFDAFLGAQLTPTGVDPNRDYFFAAGMAVASGVRPTTGGDRCKRACW